MGSHAAFHAPHAPLQSRLGMFGWSYGGYLSLMTAAALGKAVSATRSKGLNAAAPVAPAAVVAVASPTDWLHYHAPYTERLLGIPSTAERRLAVAATTSAANVRMAGSSVQEQIVAILNHIPAPNELRTAAVSDAGLYSRTNAYATASVLSNGRPLAAGLCVSNTGRIGPGILLMHGAADDNVHMAHSAFFASAAISEGVPLAFSVYPNASHALNEDPQLTVHAYHRIAQFISQRIVVQQDPTVALQAQLLGLV